MTDELIKVLAEKLGIAVEGATSWLQMAIPQYCQMKAFSKGAACLCVFVIFCLVVIFTVRSLKNYKRLKETADSHESKYIDADKDNALTLCITLCFFTVFFFIIFAWLLTSALSWGLFPNAMVLSTLIYVF